MFICPVQGGTISACVIGSYIFLLHFQEFLYGVFICLENPCQVGTFYSGSVLGNKENQDKKSLSCGHFHKCLPKLLLHFVVYRVVRAILVVDDMEKKVFHIHI